MYQLMWCKDKVAFYAVQAFEKFFFQKFLQKKHVPSLLYWCNGCLLSIRLFYANFVRFVGRSG
jgi:hypothetical protein